MEGGKEKNKKGGKQMRINRGRKGGKQMRINSIPEWAVPFILSRGTITVDGKKHEYHVLSRHLEPELLGFLGFPGGIFLFVSEDVPSAFVPFVLGHEVREFTELSGQVGRCLAALRRELEEVPNDLRDRYIIWRRNFFERLVTYYRQRGETDTEFFKEICASLAHLRQMA